MKYSLTQGSILVMVLGTILVSWGFSENCSGEITSKLVQYIPLIIGGISGWIGRHRKGDLTPLGFKK